MKTRYGISRTFWVFSLTIILFLGSLLGSLYVYSEYISYNERAKEISDSYFENNKMLLKEEADRVFDHFRLIQEYESASGRSAAEIRQMLLEHSQDIRYHQTGTIFIMGANGTILSHPDKSLVGKNISRMSDSDAPDLGNELILLAKKSEGGYTEHFWKERQHLKPVLKLVYVRAYEPFQLVVGTEISLENMQNIAEQSRKEMTDSVFRRILLILSVMIVIVIFSTVVFYLFARRVREDFSQFTAFFKNNAVSETDLDPEKFSFFETHLLAQNANRMNGDIREKNRILNTEIQERKQAQEELIKLSQAVEQSPAIVVITDVNGAIEYVNPKFTEITGYMPSEAIGNNLRIIRSGFQLAEFYRNFWNTIRSGRNWKGEFHNKKKNGEMYWESALVTSIRNAEGKITHFLKVGDDISERKRLEQNMEYLAHHDALTTLPNRLLFSDRLHHALTRARRSGKKVAVMIMDIDNFKNVNDTLGHDAGDALLKLVVTRFMKYLREEDTASRMGGDEFNFLIGDLVGTDDLKKVLERMIGSFREPFNVKNASLHITPSIGVALFPDHGQDMATLIKNADIALYQVKASGKNNYRFFGGEAEGTTFPVSGT